MSDLVVGILSRELRSARDNMEVAERDVRIAELYLTRHQEILTEATGIVAEIASAIAILQGEKSP
jgi:hypothetical protein